MEWVFWGCIAAIVYSYAIYPLLLMSCSALFQLWQDNRYIWRSGHRRSQAIQSEQSLPAVTVVIAAYNEQSCIAKRVENILSQNYPPEKLTLLVGSDGSTDSTAEILAAIDNPRLTACLFTQNRGKISVLNDLMTKANSEIIVLTDANTMFKPDTVRCLVRHFSDPNVGAVCGELQLVDAEYGNNRDGVYWKYERLLKFHESRLNALLGANGANYAIRHSLYRPLPTNTVIDDYKIAMEVARLGYQLKYDPEAVATEDSAPTIKDEMGRRIRIGLGNYQACFQMRWMFNPANGWRFFSYLSHKVLRWFAPHFMLTALIINLFLLQRTGYQILFVMQLLFYGLALYGYQQHSKGRQLPMFLSLIVFFVSMNYALLVGFVRYFTTNIQGTWQRTER
jgi:cellulose synthase/poly-beta-1,6-N-acetylglucosamine synthase-like glycosyltransferase